ncbi:nuclear transport factor 2 family protein [Alphaproteobacteria bacterium]|nr:nuclear transport factor 2 family protein [Alphaproteobacteria bacterium]
MAYNTHNQNQLELVKQYFDAWNNQDTSRLSSLVSDNIKLTDWNTTANGRKEFLAANENIFAENPEIKAGVVKLYQNQTQIIAQLKIQLTPNTDQLDVIDYFEIHNGLIVKIKAYRGF